MAEICSHMQLHKKTKTDESTRCVNKRVQPLEDHLQLCSILPIDETHQIKGAKLRMPLEDRPDRCPASLLDMVEKDNAATW